MPHAIPAAKLMTRALFSLLTLCLCALSVNASAYPCASAQQSAVKNYILRIVPTLKDLTHASVQAWGGGGGNHQTIPTDSGSPFAGRQFGGGDRKTIFGTRAYGSGYPFGADNSSTISGRPFPYGTWPISFGAYLGGQEYLGPTIDVQRPGGLLATIKVGSTDTKKWPSIASAEVYDMVGDRDSIVFMMADLVNWCHATPVWPTTFDPSDSRSVKPSNVIQYYRASSFALAYFAYNNSFAHSNPSTSLSFDQSTPLPSNISSSAFLQCINSTIGTALPIVDAPPVSHKLPTYAIVLLSTLIPLAVVVFIVILVRYAIS